MSNFYVTTPIYYVNDIPHIGHAYTTVVADVLNRYHKLFGDESYFVTGVDEHGQKIQQAAKKRELDPQIHCDEMAVNFKNIWKELNIDYDFFFRTTDDFHKKSVQECLNILYSKGEIYSQEYEGWYSVSEEMFFTEKDLVDGKSPSGREVVLIKEKNYFFKMSKYQQRLLDYIEANPKYIQPENRKNEVLGFLRQPLQDLSISRPKSRLSWGIELPFDKDHVTYVWFDALLNYANAVGFNDPKKTSDMAKWWNRPNGATHIIGKDILTTHAIYWSTMLMALEADLPNTIFAHGWWLTAGNEKMSKSQGPVVSPLDMKNIVGVDGLRYFLIRDINFGNDAQFSPELVVARVNTELANNLGNMLSRTTNLIAKYFDGKKPELLLSRESSLQLKSVAQATPDRVREHILNLELNKAVGVVVELLTEANKYLENEAPWKAAKENLAHAQESLTVAIEVLRISALLLFPVMPSKMKDLLASLGYQESISFEQSKKWDVIPSGQSMPKSEPLFPRIQT